MYYEASRALPATGFNFTNCKRNADLIKSGFRAPQPRSTGTTIVGAMFKQGIVLGADTRGLNGSIITEKRTRKVMRITSNIYCCGAGTAADAVNVCEATAAQMNLLEMYSKRKLPVVAAITHMKHILFEHQGDLRTAFVIGGVDKSGSYIYGVYPNGSSDKLPYVTLGSGNFAAMAVMELAWRPNLSKKSAVAVVKNAVRAGVLNDLASGGAVDICIITKNGVEYKRFLIEIPQKLLKCINPKPKPQCRLQSIKCKLKKKYEVCERIIKLTST